MGVVRSLEVGVDCLVYIELWLAQDPGRKLVLFHSQQNIVRDHFEDHLEHIISHVLFIELEELQFFSKPVQLQVRSFKNFFSIEVINIISHHIFEAGSLDDSKVVVKSL